LGVDDQFEELVSHFEGHKISQDFGYTIPILIIASIWINDTMAYIVGSLIGKTLSLKFLLKKPGRNNWWCYTSVILLAFYLFN
jgi:phosphatidate cytidylyltransferase